MTDQDNFTDPVLQWDNAHHNRMHMAHAERMTKIEEYWQREIDTFEQRIVSVEKLVQGLYRMLRLLGEESKDKKLSPSSWSDLPR